MSILNESPRVLSMVGLLALTLLAGLLGSAAADPIDVQGGTVVLPVSGLAIDLPLAGEGCGFRISGSFALSEDATYDGRDVVDEFSGAGLLAGTWISLGYFNAGDPASVVASVALTEDWSAQYDLWGANWSVHGGVFTFDNDLGAKPAIVACTTLSSGMAVMLHRFFLTEPPSMTQAAMLAELEQASVPRAAWLACTQGHGATVYPTKRPETRNRGAVEPSRLELLANSGIALVIPDDGFVWLVRSGGEGSTDFLDRMAPALPDVSIEVAYLIADDCEAGLASIDTEKRDVPPQNLPPGWTAGPQLVVEGNVELTACYETVDGVVVVGIFQGAQTADVAYLAPMLAAIAEAVDGE